MRREAWVWGAKQAVIFNRLNEEREPACLLQAQTALHSLRQEEARPFLTLSMKGVLQPPGGGRVQGARV